MAKAFWTVCSVVLWGALVIGQGIPAYDRGEWNHWTDEDGDCLSTRHEVLARDAVMLLASNRNGCQWLTGEWLDPYTGQTYRTTSALHIDHVVSLADAHVSGAWMWTAEEKETFANDPRNLLAVSARVNIQKSARGPADWRPPDPAYWCAYAERYAAVKTTYDLTVTMPDAKALASLLATCTWP
jgi:hypothetical protein